MQTLLDEIQQCTICIDSLPHGPYPVVSFNENSRILIIGQAPGSKVHKTGIPWDDPSGRQLRSWLGVSDEEFYDPNKFGLVPMGFCYPGKGKGGDLPPRPECAPKWHSTILKELKNVQLTILIGQYSQKYYLKKSFKENLTNTVKAYEEYLPDYFPLPHPSPRNRFWQSKNPWFNSAVVDHLQQNVYRILNE